MSKTTININLTRSPPPPPQSDSNGNWIWIAVVAIAAYYYYPQFVPQPTTQTTQTQTQPQNNDTPLPPETATTQKFILPVKGQIGSGFGMRPHPILRHKSGPKKGQPIERMHNGLDVSAPTGTPIKASKDGVVIFSGWNGGYGNCVKIRHSNGYVTLYGHNSKNLANKDQKVKQGDIIAEVGSTGLSTGPHLHWEIRKPDGTKIDPKSQL